MLAGRVLVGGAIAALAIAGCRADHRGPPAAVAIAVIDGYDWSVPAGVGRRGDAGFYSDAVEPMADIDARVLDLTWRQLEPVEGELRRDTFGAAQGLEFPSWNDQRAAGGRYWLRLWMTGLEWAPPWLAEACGIFPVSGQDADGQYHIPLWQPCVWSKARALYARLFDAGLLADPDLVLAYVPGGFTWHDFDFEVIDRAVIDDGLDARTFVAWFHQMIADLAALAGPDVGKLVYTGEDYPRASFGPLVERLAADAVAAGLGIRMGRSELANDHRVALPAWGAAVDARGHLAVDPARPPRLRAAEQDCFDSCGLSVADADELGYAIRTANWSALALGASWLYVVFPDSHLADLPEHWRWVRAELGRTAVDAFDGWAVLREAEDTLWREHDELVGPTRPWIHNLERFVIQREVGPDGLTRRGTEVRHAVLDPRNGTAYEGRRTDAAHGGDAIYFAIDPAWLSAGAHALEVQVTFVDSDCGGWQLAYVDDHGPTRSPVIGCGDTGAIRTARLRLPRVVVGGGLPGATDLAVVRAGVGDVEVRYLRVVRE